MSQLFQECPEIETALRFKAEFQALNNYPEFKIRMFLKILKYFEQDHFNFEAFTFVIVVFFCFIRKSLYEAIYP